MSESEGHSYLKQHTLSGDALLINLTEAAASVIDEALQAKSGHAARTLVKEGPLRMTIVGFKQGASINEHKAGGAVSIEVLSGTVVLTVAGATEQLDSHETLVLAKDLPHSVAAKTDAAILLTISMPA